MIYMEGLTSMILAGLRMGSFFMLRPTEKGSNKWPATSVSDMTREQEEDSYNIRPNLPVV